MPLVTCLKAERLSFGHTLIFCQRKLDCGNLYHLFQLELGEELAEPIEVPCSLPQYWLVNVYTKATEEHVKVSVLKQFNGSSCLRVVVYIAAFGMDVDCVDVNNVVHYGLLNDVETYIQ